MGTNSEQLLNCRACSRSGLWKSFSCLPGQRSSSALRGRAGHPRCAPGPCSLGTGALGSRGQQRRRWELVRCQADRSRAFYSPLLPPSLPPPPPPPVPPASAPAGRRSELRRAARAGASAWRCESGLWGGGPAGTALGEVGAVGVRPFQEGEQDNGAKLLLWAVSLLRRSTEGKRGDAQNERKKM